MRTYNLAGNAYEVGLRVGKLIREALVERLRQQLGPESTWPALLEKHSQDVAAYRNLLAELAPHWYEEAAGMADGAGLPIDAILLLNANPKALSPAAMENCTAFMVIGAASGCGANLLHKNRDEKPLPQSFFVKHVIGKNRIMGGVEIGGLGLAQMVNEHGLAGANNTGPLIAAGGTEYGLDDRHVLRLVAEEARNCQEALKVCQSLVQRRFVRRLDGERGMIFLFADPEQGLVVEMTPWRAWYQFSDDGLVCRSNHFLLSDALVAVAGRALPAEPESSTALRYARAEELLRPKLGHLRPEDLIVAGQDTTNWPNSICNANTVSMMTHRLAREAEGRTSWVCNGYPLRAPICEWPHNMTATPVDCLDGSGWVSPPR
ncbi:MAG: C45 family peptidase [Armatimonadetes bacterium]|nr:C45 family peptidase [Armatimonadota bacterium]